VRAAGAVRRGGPFPEDGYQGDYIRDVARGLVESRGASIPDEEEATFRAAVRELDLADIRATQDRLAIHFDNYFNEDRCTPRRRSSGAPRRSTSASSSTAGRRDLAARREGRPRQDASRQDSGEPAYRLPTSPYHQTSSGAATI